MDGQIQASQNVARAKRLGDAAQFDRQSTASGGGDLRFLTIKRREPLRRRQGGGVEKRGPPAFPRHRAKRAVAKSPRRGRREAAPTNSCLGLGWSGIAGVPGERGAFEKFCGDVR